uniref:Uncharacterized protein n=1 Tax=Toxoplasma gondii (strain ATCC 50861 / VEG) TaxID=432359 RepID=A0A0F7VBI5_TOXGV|nr:TPA: hypothetical protein BN1205_029930 [Toxoplasma gondii VEG]
MALAFSRMSLVAYLRGWSVWEMVGRIAQGRESVYEIVGRILQEVEVFARGLTALWHDLSTCWVWRPLMGRLVRGRSVVGCMRECVRRYWLCVFVQSVCEMVAVVVQKRTVRDETDARGCSAFRGNCRTT